MPIFIQINDIDNVAVALHPAPAGTAFGGATAVEDIPQGHKMALKDMEKENPDHKTEKIYKIQKKMVRTREGVRLI